MPSSNPLLAALGRASGDTSRGRSRSPRKKRQQPSGRGKIVSFTTKDGRQVEFEAKPGGKKKGDGSGRSLPPSFAWVNERVEHYRGLGVPIGQAMSAAGEDYRNDKAEAREVKNGRVTSVRSKKAAPRGRGRSARSSGRGRGRSSNPLAAALSKF